MAGKLTVADIRVQQVSRNDGRKAFTVLTQDGRIHGIADSYLRSCSGGTDRTYAYLLVDHLRWLRFEGLTLESVSVRDLQRYMGAVGAAYAGPFGRPWRSGKRPYAQSTLVTAAACLKGFYLHQGAKGIRGDIANELKKVRLPTLADRQRTLFGHAITEVTSNPLTPKTSVRQRHPKLPPENARDVLTAVASTARDKMVISWLADGGFRLGELCGLHLVDLHLREGAACGQCRSRHVHICHRDTNPNGARVKSKHPWRLESGTVVGGLIRRVSPVMVHTYFEYMTTEYPADVEHGMLLVQLTSAASGEPWSPTAARAMLASVSGRAGIGKVRPHSFRHQFATDILNASRGNSLIARDAGGWSSATTVNEIYGHTDVDDPLFSAVLEKVWGTT